MQKLVVEHPKITNGIDEAHTRLSATVRTDHFTKDLYYEVENEYGQYLCEERGDAFLVGLLYFAMVNGYDMEIKAPVSEKLYYQLTKQYIPTMAKNRPTLFNLISVSAPLDSTPIKNAGAVGAAASRGVDFSYTILKNSNLEEKNYNITHLMICNSYSNYEGENETRNRFARSVKNAKELAQALQLPVVAIYSNEHDFWFPHIINLNMLRYMGFVYAVQRLFRVYNFSATYEYKIFNLDSMLSDHSEFFTAPLISNENLTIYSSGSEARRAEKVAYIADDPVLQKLLRVCNDKEENCCECVKCTQIQAELWSIGKLDKFLEVFPKNNFQKNKSRILRKIVAKKSDDDLDVLKNMKKNHLQVPLSAAILGNLEYYTWTQIKELLRNTPYIRAAYLKMKSRKVTSDSDPVSKSSMFNNSKEYAARYNDIVW